MTAIYVLTCARPVEEEGDEPWPYVGATCEAIAKEEIAMPHLLFVDGAAPPLSLVGERWTIVEWERPHMALRGNKLPYWALLEHAYENGFDDVVVLEDDLEFCTHAVRRMATFPVPDDLALVQFFAPQISLAPHTQPGLWRPPATSFAFCQAIKFPRRTLSRLIEWSREREWSKFAESDVALNLALQRLGMRYGVHAPDLVQHVGENSATVPGSSVRPTSGRVSECFPDPGFDALRLYDLDIRYR